MNDPQLQNAMQLRRAGRLAEAAQIYAEILRREPRHFDALHSLGTLRYQMGQLDEAERLIGEATKVNPRAPDAFYNRACLLQKLNRPQDALVAFDAALKLKPDYVEALVNRASVLLGMNRLGETLEGLDKVLRIRPEIAQVWNNRGNVLAMLGKGEDALASYDRALAIAPTYGDAWKNRARALIQLERREDGLVALNKLAELAPNDPDVWIPRANLMFMLGRYEESLPIYERGLTLNSRDADGWFNRGMAMLQLNRRSEALTSFDRAIAINPGHATARENRAHLNFVFERFEEAGADYELLSRAENAGAWLKGYVAICRLHCCDWRGLDGSRKAIAADLHAGLFVIDPTGNAVISSSVADQLECARVWVREKFPPAQLSLWRLDRYRHDKIRVAYLSADFRAHATAFLMAGIFERHDRSRFETIAISFGADDKSPMRARLMAAFDRFIDVRDKNDVEVAYLLRELEVDVLVDLKGFTAEGRPGILALRPAPVQASYLGFPGTMGAPYVDYMLADRFVVPDEHLPHYTEKPVYLPDTYQCNDRARRAAERAPSRAECGLPEGGFVFCCFNNNHKIMPEIFDVWMRLLDNLKGSVLWLLQDNISVPRNLRGEAEARGVDASRLIFAARTDPSSHLARQRLADLFLDTLPYNAHTTASDALWVGLPLITCLGTTFAGRVAASLLNAIGLPELVTSSLADYEARALALARDPVALAAIKAKLARNRDRFPLFDTDRMTRSLEAAYEAMWARAQRDEAPAAITIPALPLAP
jgi:predicted O-linked N-acetylglucosamine transferase (SPINDLY family)